MARAVSLLGAMAFGLGFSVSLGSFASAGSPDSFVTATVEAHSGLLEKLPALRSIDQAVREDCAAKVPKRTSSDAFCTCAAAVTISLWRADEAMRQRLVDFVKQTGKLSAADFKDFQGPELYKPVCSAAGL